jgi:putative flavoprotein involved in K+ transport
MPFPPTFPAYIPKDKLANWFEAYVESMELNFWTDFAFAGGDYDEQTGHWTATLRRSGGSERVHHPRHIVMASGVSGIPNLPDVDTLKQFQWAILHSCAYTDGEDWAGKRAIIIGTGYSGHEIAQGLHASGAEVTMVQRSPTLIVSIEPSAQLHYTLYDEGPPLEDCDLITAAMPLPLARETHRQITEQAKALGKSLLDALGSTGFRLDYGENNTGWQFKYLSHGGGYCFNVGC